MDIVVNDDRKHHPLKRRGLRENVTVCQDYFLVIAEPERYFEMSQSDLFATREQAMKSTPVRASSPRSKGRPARAGLSRAAVRRGLPCQARSATRSTTARERGCWSTFGPPAIGTERFTTVSSGRSFAQVVGRNPGETGPGAEP